MAACNIIIIEDLISVEEEQTKTGKQRVLISEPYWFPRYVMLKVEYRSFSNWLL